MASFRSREIAQFQIGNNGSGMKVPLMMGALMKPQPQIDNLLRPLPNSHKQSVIFQPYLLLYLKFFMLTMGCFKISTPSSGSITEVNSHDELEKEENERSKVTSAFRAISKSSLWKSFDKSQSQKSPNNDSEKKSQKNVWRPY